MPLVVNIGNYSELPTQGLTMTTISPGGCGELRFSYETRPPYLGLIDLVENDRVEVFDSQGLIWRGRLEVRRPKIAYGSGIWQITALGYAASLRDRVYHGVTFWNAGTAIETIFTDVRNALCPDISTSNALITATGRTLNGSSRDVNGQGAQEIYEQARIIGNSAYQTLYWHVWEGPPGIANKAELELVGRPSTPAYHIGLVQGAEVDLEWNLSNLYNRILIKWGTGTDHTQVDHLDSQAARPLGYGVVRTKYIVSDLINNFTDAQNAGGSILNETYRVRAMAHAIRIPGTALIEDAAGSRVPPWRVRAGGIVRIRELKAGGIAIQDYDFLVAQTTWDEDAGILTLTPEGLEDLTHMIARYMRKEHLT
jgi:hypothetical protein